MSKTIKFNCIHCNAPMQAKSIEAPATSGGFIRQTKNVLTCVECFTDHQVSFQIKIKSP